MGRRPGVRWVRLLGLPLRLGRTAREPGRGGGMPRRSGMPRRPGARGYRGGRNAGLRRRAAEAGCEAGGAGERGWAKRKRTRLGRDG